MRKFSFWSLLMAAAFVVGLGGGATMMSQPGYADGNDNPCSGMRGRKRRKCERENSNIDKQLYQAGYWLAKTGQYEDALKILRQVSDQNSPAVLNYIGYSTRKLGDVDGALVYYKKALKIAPDFTLARSYMGEAFLQKGDAVKAREQLAEIGKRCGVSCQEYATLAKEIADFEIRQS